MGTKLTTVYHTRIKRETIITNVQRDKYNPVGLVIEFSWTGPINYYKDDQQMTFGLYMDKEFVEEFNDRMIKIQVANLNVVQTVEIYAHPHGGYQHLLTKTTPGNKIRARFRAKDPNKTDIKQHDVYWDNKTGTYLAKKAGTIDPLTGNVSGSVFNVGEIVS